MEAGTKCWYRIKNASRRQKGLLRTIRKDCCFIKGNLCAAEELGRDGSWGGRAKDNLTNPTRLKLVLYDLQSICPSLFISFEAIQEDISILI